MKSLQAVYRCDECGDEKYMPLHSTDLPTGWIELLGVKRFNIEGAKHVCGVLCLAKYAAEVAGGRYFSWYDINTGTATRELGR
jgi:hypothetical protein